MSKEKIQASLNAARGAAKELEELAGNAKKARKLVASGRYADLKAQATSKKQEVARLEAALKELEEEKVDAPPAPDTTEEIKKEKTAEVEVKEVKTKSWWKFWG